MKALPAAYAWLNKLVVPRTIGEALNLYGVTEKVGAANNPEIMAWANECGITGYNADSIPWCGLFAAVVVKRAGKAVVAKPLWARDWAHFGVVPAAAGLGDVLVFSREGGGGHVGFYVAEDDTAYHVLGGNQGDKVSIVRIAKQRCIAVRRPAYNTQPESVKPYRVAASGSLSRNEA